MALKKVVIFLETFLVCWLLFLLTITTPALARHKDSSDEDSKERVGGHQHRVPQEAHRKGDRDTTSPTSQRYTSARAYVDDRKRGDGYRYYGSGSKSGNSFLPTNIHKSTSSLDSNNYFVTTKSNVKDLDTASSGMAGGSEGNQYLQVYDSPPPVNNNMMYGGGAGGGGSGGMNGGMNGGMMGMDEHYGDMMSETGSGGGGGSGYGYGKGCNSALGLLGVLGLAAYLQNVLRMMNGTTAGRRKRDISFNDPHNLEAKLEKVRTGMATNLLTSNADLLPLMNKTMSKSFKLSEETYKKVMRDVFPLLSAVAHAKDGLIPIHCTHSSVCLANQVLVKDLGYLGHTIGIRISTAIAKLLNKITKDERAEQIRMIHKAGKMGRNGRNCLKVFPTCNRLKNLPTYNIPLILNNDHHGAGNSTSPATKNSNGMTEKKKEENTKKG